ncbi:MAG: two-component sensor histidine kinase [Chloroflexi bacterium]|nr:two-component sensor histidine kinase [Chloroflexota bacterium]
MFRSIRWRIAIPYVILILLVMVVMGIYLSRLLRQTYLRNLDNQLITEAIVARDSLIDAFGTGSSSVKLDSRAKHLAALIDARVTLIAADGTVLGDSHDDLTSMDNHANRPEILQAAAQGQGSSERYSKTEDQEMFYAAVPVINQNQKVGFIRLALPLLQVQSNIRQVERTILFFTLVASVIAIFLAMLIASQTTRPLRDLTEATTQIASGDLSVHIIPVSKDEVGQLTRAFNTMGERLRYHVDELESERSRLSAVLDEMSDGVLIIDGYGKIQLINKAAEEMFGIGHDKAIGSSLIEAVRQYQLMELWQKYRQTGELQAVLIEIPTKKLYLQTVATSLGKALPESTLLLLQNLTRLRHLETVRQDFITNISHELRTPLASLKALTETLQDTALDDPPAARRFLQQIETEVDALSLMVSELLELSRIESGKVPLKMEATSPTDLINQAVERLQLQAERAGLEIQTTCQTNLPMVLADPSRMEQVLVNLLHNAIKFTPANGVISIGCHLNDDKMLFSVKDTGIGIPADDLPRIFERFYKTDRARSGGGTGLGLAISRHIIEAHGGKIWAESIEGQGSTFYFTIPLAT